MSVEGNFCTHINGKKNFCKLCWSKRQFISLQEWRDFLCPYYLLQEEKYAVNTLHSRLRGKCEEL